MPAFVRRPAVHFVLLGTALFFLMQWLNPPPRPSVGPLPQSQVENLKRQWFAGTGRLPDGERLEGMIRAQLDREILFREALQRDIHLHDPVVRQRLLRNMHFLRLGEGKTEEALYQSALRMELHLGDEVVKRRLIQVMEQLLLARNPVAQPGAEELLAEFVSRRAQLRRPVRYSIEHIYLTRQREPEADALLASIRARQMSPAQARQFSSPFLPGYRFNARTPAQLARNFGAAFVNHFEQLAPQAGQWVGPVQSTYGYHLVWVAALEPERDARLDEVRDQLLRDMKLERRRLNLRQSVARLRENYELLL